MNLLVKKSTVYYIGAILVTSICSYTASILCLNLSSCSRFLYIFKRMNTIIGKAADEARNVIDSIDEKFIAHPPHESY